MKESARKSQTPVSADVRFSGDQEFSLSTLMLLCLALHWHAAGASSQVEEKRKSGVKAQMLLGIFIDKLLGQGSFRVLIPIADKELALSGGKVDASAFFAGTSCARMAFAKQSSMTLTSLLEALWELASAKKPDAKHALAKSMVRAILNMLVERCEALDVGLVGNAYTLPVLHISGSDKPRRVPISKKLDLMQRVAGCSSIRTPGQLVAAEIALKQNSANSASSSVKPRSAQRFVRDTMYQYMLSSQKVWSHAVHVSLSCDAGRVSGDDMLQQVFYSTDLQTASWGPPQVQIHTGIFRVSKFEVVRFWARLCTDSARPVCGEYSYG